MKRISKDIANFYYLPVDKQKKIIDKATEGSNTRQKELVRKLEKRPA